MRAKIGNGLLMPEVILYIYQEVAIQNDMIESINTSSDEMFLRRQYLDYFPNGF